MLSDLIREILQKNMRINFEIEPQSQLRPKFSSRPFPHEYDPKPTKTYKAQLHLLAIKKMQELKMEPLEGSLMVNVVFYRNIQKSLSKAEHERRVSGKVLPSVKPDIDNYTKAFLDALNGVVWRDDSQITDKMTRKRYSNNPHIELEVLPIK